MPYADPAAQREYQRAWVASRRTEWFEQNGPCVDCDTWNDLQLDHEDAEAKVSHRLWSWSGPRRVAELSKCVARCRPCHRAKTTTAGERPRGEANGRSVATAEQVREIRCRVRAGEAQAAVAREMGYDRRYVNDIVRGKAWKFEN